MGIPTDPFARPSLIDTVADRLLQLVLSAQFVSGERLPPVADMIQMFGVSPETLRSALEKLTLAGVLNVRPGVGVYVNEGRRSLFNPAPSAAGSYSKDLLLDIVEAREPIDIPAAELAAVHASERDLDQLAACLQEEMESANDEARHRADVRFHTAIAEASSNGVLLTLQRSFLTMYRKEQLVMCRHIRSPAAAYSEHLALLDAIRRRDPALAADRMRAHLDGIRRAIDRWEG